MAKTAAYIFGAVLAVVGVWGFFQNPVLDIFTVNTLHNIVHLASGLVLLAAAMWGRSVMALMTLGVVYLVVAVLQFVMPDLTASLLNTNSTDLGLHVALAVVFIAVAWMSKGSSAPAGQSM
jgi:hypothetical protein